MQTPLRLRTGRSALRVSFALVVLAMTLPGIAVRAATADDASEPKRPSRVNFSLLPKSFQRRPALDFHVISELTAEGKKRPAPTSAQPVYYIAQPGQFTQMGDNVYAGETPPDVERLTHAMEAALASSEYRKASPNTPLPALAVVFNYGSFARFSMAIHDMQDDMMLQELGMTDAPLLRSEDRDSDALVPILLSNKNERDEVLRRASLIGGENFARQLAKVLAEEATYRSGDDALRSLGFSAPTGASPFQRFRGTNANLTMLVEDSFNGCYFVIASAYDYVAMRQGKKVLLWRTKMTVNSNGISMTESLPPLVQAAGPFLGKEMTEAVTLSRTISRGGNVKLHDMHVLETDVALPTVPAPARK